MTITVSPYILPDAFLFAGIGNGHLVWQPETACLVLGQSNSVEKSLIVENVISDGIPVTKRPTGGEAVMLTPLTIVITVARTFSALVHFRDYFRSVNGMIIATLQEFGISGLSMKGISDIALGNKKILGSSMRSTHGRLIYHAVLNVSEDPDLFEKYLRHPCREPIYRTGRSHSEFVTSLKAEGYDIKTEELMASIRNKLDDYLISID